MTLRDSATNIAAMIRKSSTSLKHRNPREAQTIQVRKTKTTNKQTKNKNKNKKIQQNKTKQKTKHHAQEQKVKRGLVRKVLPNT